MACSARAPRVPRSQRTPVIWLGLLVGVAAILVLVALLTEGTSSEVEAPAPEIRSQTGSRTDRRSVADFVKAAAAAPEDTPGAPTKVVVRGTWGSEPGQFGKLQAEESNPEAPMSLAVDGQGNLSILDQVNRRVQRFDRTGKLLGTLPIRSETTQDLAVEGDKTYLLDRLGAEPGIEVLDSQGRPVERLPAVGGAVKEGGAITGLFTSSGAVYVENEHDDLVRVDGASNEEIPGRPSRDGRLYLKAAVVEKSAGRIYVQAHAQKDRDLAWETPLNLGRPLLHLLMLDSDRSGQVYVAAEVGQEDPQTHAFHDLATLVIRLSPEGRLDGVLSLPPTTAEAAETFRPLVVGDDGTIYHMLVTEAGLQVTAHSF
jgi:hypothetical protein